MVLHEEFKREGVDYIIRIARHGCHSAGRVPQSLRDWKVVLGYAFSDPRNPRRQGRFAEPEAGLKAGRWCENPNPGPRCFGTGALDMEVR